MPEVRDTTILVCTKLRYLNAHIANALTYHENGKCCYTAALEIAVIKLNEQVDALKDVRCRIRTRIADDGGTQHGGSD